MPTQAAIIERDGPYWRLTVWFESEEEARKALEALKAADAGRTGDK